MGPFRASILKHRYTGTAANEINVQFVWMSDATKNTVGNNVLSALFKGNPVWKLQQSNILSLTFW